MTLRTILAWTLLCAASLSLPAAAGAAEPPPSGPPQETKAQRDQRMAWWREARFGMFIHWGLYAAPAGQWNGKKVPSIGEWIQFNAKIPPDQYEPLVKKFNPVKFNAQRWAQIARRAGMKYMVITSKHHEGFCLFDSALTDYDVMSTPFKRDVMKELSEACRQEGIKMCWYHSILDWHHPDYLPRGPGSPRPWDTRPTQGADYHRYLDTMKGQLRELLTRYGPIGVIWFDGGWEHSAKEHRADEVVKMIRSLQPGIIINDRIQLPQDFNTPEQFIPATGTPGRDWETCMTMNDTWGYKQDDHNWKSTETLLRNLIDIVSKGGNYLLNVGPTAEGEFPQPIVERLQQMGRWMEVNGEAIYGTSASPFKRLAWGRCTTKIAKAEGGTLAACPTKLYLHVFDWPKGNLRVPGLRSKVAKAYLLAQKQGKPLEVTAAEDGVLIKLPAAAPDKVASVVVLEIVGEPEVVAQANVQAADGTIRLAAADAEIHGTTAQYETGGGKDNIGFWTDAKDWVSWDVAVKTPGKFEVQVTYACESGTAGSTFAVGVRDQKVTGKVESTGAWNKFVDRKLGTLGVAGPGRVTITVKPESKPGFAVMNLKAVALRPVK